MTEPPSPHREEIFAFSIEPPDEHLPEVALADDQDTSALTGAGIVAARAAALVERAYVGERMAATSTSSGGARCGGTPTSRTSATTARRSS